MEEKDAGKVIGVYSLCNAAAVNVYEITEERVLASWVGEKSEWCRISEVPHPETGEPVSGFWFHLFFISFDEVERVM